MIVSVDILNKYKPDALPIEEKAKYGLLPDRLTPTEISTLWAKDEEMRVHYMEFILRSMMKRIALAHDLDVDISIDGYLVSDYDDSSGTTKIHKADFRRWLKQEGCWPLRGAYLLPKWFGKNKETSVHDKLDFALFRLHNDLILRKELPGWKALEEQGNQAGAEEKDGHQEFPQNADDEITKADAELGRKIRAQNKKFGELRHSVNEAREELWKPYIQEGRELLERGISKLSAARIVASRHPDKKLKFGTLRQKL